MRERRRFGTKKGGREVERYTTVEKDLVHSFRRILLDF